MFSGVCWLSSKPGRKPETPTASVHRPPAPSVASPLRRYFAAHARTPTPSQAMLHLLTSPLAYAAPEKANVMKYFFGSK